MPTVLQVEDGVDITQRPDKAPYRYGNQIEVTLGDAHGNALNLWRFAVREGLVSVSKADYSDFVRIYYALPKKLDALAAAEAALKQAKTDEQKTVAQKAIELARAEVQADVTTFHQLLNRARVNPNCPLVRLMGDELFDRGSNDYFTLKILEKLGQENVRYEILASNHGMEFLLQALKGFSATAASLTSSYMLEKVHRSGRSYLNLLRLFDADLPGIDRKNISLLVSRHYFPHLKLVSYQRDDASGEFIRYIHAPVNLQTLEEAVYYLQINHHQDGGGHLSHTPENICAIYDALNAALATAIKRDEVDILFDGYMRNPLVKMLWQRLDERDEFTGFQPLPGERIVHGHDGKGAVPRGTEHFVINLDNLLGHEGMPNSHRGQYTCATTTLLPLAELEQRSTYFFNAIAMDDRQAVITAITGGTVVNQVNPRGETPLLVAAQNRHLGMVDLLISYRADISTAAAKAVEESEWQAAVILLQKLDRLPGDLPHTLIMQNKSAFIDAIITHLAAFEETQEAQDFLQNMQIQDNALGILCAYDANIINIVTAKLRQSDASPESTATEGTSEAALDSGSSATAAAASGQPDALTEIQSALRAENWDIALDLLFAAKENSLSHLTLTAGQITDLKNAFIDRVDAQEENNDAKAALLELIQPGVDNKASKIFNTHDQIASASSPMLFAKTLRTPYDEIMRPYPDTKLFRP